VRCLACAPVSIAQGRTAAMTRAARYPARVGRRRARNLTFPGHRYYVYSCGLHKCRNAEPSRPMSGYDFHDLSSLDLEELVRDLLQREWHIRLETFKTGSDQGIDLRFSTDGEGDRIIQCKHYAASGVQKLIRHLRTSEVTKVARLKPARYVLATSVGLTPANKTR